MLGRSGGRCPLSLRRAGSSVVRAASLYLVNQSRVQIPPGRRILRYHDRLADVNDETKLCTGCGQIKPQAGFSKQAKAKDGLQSICKECAAAYYITNRATIYPMIKARRELMISECRQFVWEYLSAHPCIDCGEPDPIVLDFDHVKGTKRSGVSELALHGWGIHAVQTEIAKCVVRCANCHRRKTARELGWYRWELAAKTS
jgi:hypothetical protein